MSLSRRPAFEKWATQNEIDLTRWEEGGYFHDRTAQLWTAWKTASVIEENRCSKIMQILLDNPHRERAS